jgi:hypothetical protein
MFGNKTIGIVLLIHSLTIYYFVGRLGLLERLLTSTKIELPNERH